MRKRAPVVAQFAFSVGRASARAGSSAASPHQTVPLPARLAPYPGPAMAHQLEVTEWCAIFCCICNKSSSSPVHRSAHAVLTFSSPLRNYLQRLSLTALRPALSSIWQNTQSSVYARPVETLWLCLFAFLAGFVDSVVGGGGLIQLPALFLFLPQPLAESVAGVFGTNKLSSICGTGMAVIQYSRHVRIPWHLMVPAGLAALVFSFLGAR